MSIVLSPIEFSNGILSLVFVVLSISIGLIMIARYFKYKTINLILAGMTWIVICSPWWAVSASFLSTILTGNPLPINIFLLIGFPLIPIGVMSWMILMTNLVFEENRKVVLFIFGAFSAFYESFFIIFYFVDNTLLGVPAGVFDIDYALFMLISLMIVLVAALYTGTKFAVSSIKAKDPEIKLKGKFILLAWYSFVIGSFVSILSGGILAVLIFAKIIVILSAIEFYFGFILPKPIKKLFLKQD